MKDELSSLALLIKDYGTLLPASLKSNLKKSGLSQSEVKAKPITPETEASVDAFMKTGLAQRLNPSEKTLNIMRALLKENPNMSTIEALIKAAAKKKRQ